MASKTPMDVEQLVRWAYHDELSKRLTSSAEGIWDRIEDYGQRGGIDVGHGAAQRYPHFGLPHPDAEAIEKAVSVLKDAVIDWRAEAEAVMGDLLALADMRGRPTPRPGMAHTTTIGWFDRTGTWRAEAIAAPRDVILARSLPSAALVTMHAKMGTRPDWGRENPPQPYPVPAERGPNFKVIGECRGKDLYSEGSYCPLRYDPSPISVAEDRADYIAWWRGLAALASTLDLVEHVALPPAAPEMPWRDGEPPAPAVLKPLWPVRMKPLPLKPSRPLAGPRRRRKPVTTRLGDPE